MIVSTKGRYALRVMIDLAQYPRDQYIPLQDIAEREGISKEYLNSILKVLVQHKQLISLRGKGGGYRLSRPPEEYTVGTILRLVEGSLAPVTCVSAGEPCPRAEKCASLNMWKKLDTLINDFFDGIKLSDLMDGGELSEEKLPGEKSGS